MKEQTPMQELIELIENGETRLDLIVNHKPIWLEKEKKHVIEAFKDGMVAVSSGSSHMKEIYYTIKYDLDDKTIGLFHYYNKLK